MSYDQVAGIKPCVQQLCFDNCNYQETQAIWDTAVCTGADGGVGDGGTRPPTGAGCHCAAGGGGPASGGSSAGAGLTGLLLASAAATTRSRRRRKPARRASS